MDNTESDISVNSSASRKISNITSQSSSASKSSRFSFSTIPDNRLVDVIGVDKSNIVHLPSFEFLKFDKVDGLKEKVFGDIVSHLRNCRFFESFNHIEAVVDDLMLVVLKSISDFIKDKFIVENFEILRESGFCLKYLNDKLNTVEKDTISGRIEIIITSVDKSSPETRFMVFENKSGRHSPFKGLNQCLLSLACIKEGFKEQKKNKPAYGLMFNGLWWSIVRYQDKDNIICSEKERFFLKAHLRDRSMFLTDEYSKLITIIYKIIVDFLDLDINKRRSTRSRQNRIAS